MKYVCRNPKFSDFYGSSIDVLWEHPDHGEIPFTANSNDVMPYSAEIYNLALSGAFGEVAPYDRSSPEEEAEIQARVQRDALLVELDQVVANPLRWDSFTQAEKDEIAAYRQALLDVPQQQGFPEDIQWPEKPTSLL